MDGQRPGGGPPAASRRGDDASDRIGAGTRAPRRTRPLAASIEELLDGAERRDAMAGNTHGLSGASWERVTIGGAPYVVKYLHPDEDWVMRATHDEPCRAVHLWQTGYYDLLPPCIDPTIEGAATGLGADGRGSALLLRDVADTFTPEGDSIIDEEQHGRFIEHLAAMHACFWGFRDDGSLTSLRTRYRILSPEMSAAEAARGATDQIPRLVGQHWPTVASLSPATGALAAALFADPAPLIDAMADAPTTLVHGDPKFGNLGSHPDGRTVLVDWAFPGEANATVELAWYVGVNCARMPESKDATIERYRRALEAEGVPTDGWWDEQLGLALIGNFLQFGWNKAMAGRDDEFCWWEERVLDAQRFLR